MVLATTFTVSAPFGEHPVHLVLTRAGRWERLAQAAPVEREPDPANDKQIEAGSGPGRCASNWTWSSAPPT